MSKLEQKIAVDYYKILGVPKNATIQQICSQYAICYTVTDS